MDELVAAIGKYKSMDKDKSCLEEGEYDGSSIMMVLQYLLQLRMVSGLLIQ